ncbi:(d)CMP kinase [Francisellaceae bacterium CB299]|jgi:cytidylate kinase
MNNNKIITIDGPSGVGKGTLARKLAEYFGYDLLDSGAIYRLAALHCLNANIDIENVDTVAKHLENFDIRFETDDTGLVIYLDNQVVTNKIRTEEIGMLTSKIATYPIVREMLFEKQKSFATEKGLVADGRDMGTVVFPNAKFKFFLEASSEVRAKRRFDELKAKGQNPNFDIIKTDIEKRDYQDRNRKVAPLKPADDAVIVDTSKLSISEVFDVVISK